MELTGADNLTAAVSDGSPGGSARYFCEACSAALRAAASSTTPALNTRPKSAIPTKMIISIGITSANSTTL